MNLSEPLVNPMLQALCDKWVAIKAITLSDMDGSTIAKLVTTPCDTDTAGTVAASTWVMVENNIRELRQKNVKQILIKGKQGWIILQLILQKLVLLVLANPSIPCEVLSKEVNLLASQISELSERG